MISILTFLACLKMLKCTGLKTTGVSHSKAGNTHMTDSVWRWRNSTRIWGASRQAVVVGSPRQGVGLRQDPKP